MRAVTIAEELVFTCTMIECEGQTGTGFFAVYDGGTYLVTAAHVAFGESPHRLRLNRQRWGDPAPSDPIVYCFTETTRGLWRRHAGGGVDIAAMPFTPVLDELAARGDEPLLRAINLDWPTLPDNWREFDAIEEIVTLGYPYTTQDSTYLLPVARTGITASPAAHDWSREPVFLVNAAVLPGCSGSPVFVTNRHWPPMSIWTEHGKLGRPKMVTVRHNPFTFAGVLVQDMLRTSAEKVMEQTADGVSPIEHLEVEIPLSMQLGKAVRPPALVELLKSMG